MSGSVGKCFTLRARRAIFALQKQKEAMKRLIILLVLLASPAAAEAQDNLYSMFQFSFVPPLGTNGKNSAEYTNGVSLNLIAGLSAKEDNFALSGFGNIILQDAAGMQVAGLANYIGGTGKGLSLAGMTNVTRSAYAGIQLAGASNIAGDVTGLQFAGLFNVAGKVKGVQVAALVNVAEESPWPIGLVNIIKNGEMGVGISYDVLGNVVVAFRSGGKYSYGILGFGVNRKTGGKMVAEAGYGVRLPICRWFRINNEFKATNIDAGSGSPSLNLSWLLAPSLRIGRHVDISVGTGVSWFNSPESIHESLLPSWGLLRQWTGCGRTSSLYIGCQVGIQFLF